MKRSTSARREGLEIADYDRTIERARKWLVDQQRGDGSSGENLPLWAYYTQPMAFRAMGAPLPASRCLALIKRNFLLGSEEGEEERGGARTLVVQRTGVEGIAYAPAWTVVNSHMWDRYEISFPVARWIVRLQDPKLGGVYESEEAANKKDGLLEFDATIMAGHAMISSGHIDHARKVGDFLLRLHKSQPAPRERYFFMWDSKNGLITDSYDKKLTLFYVAEKNEHLQGYFQFGLSISFLSRLYMATGEQRYLVLAKEHFKFSDECVDTYSTALAHKLAWADALLYQATGETRFLEAGKCVGDHLISVQRRDGRYHYREVVPNFEDQDLTANLDIVSQFTTWLGQVRLVLGALDGTHPTASSQGPRKRPTGRTYVRRQG